MSSSRTRALVHDGTSCECAYNGRHLLIVNDGNAEMTRLIPIRLSPRPNDARLGMTRIGALRDEYNATVEGNPPRFVKTLFGYEANPAYLEWAARADTWAGCVRASSISNPESDR